MQRPVTGSRALARTVAKTVVPGTRWGVRALVGAGRAVSLLPLPLTQALMRLNDKGVRLYDSLPLPDYEKSPETFSAPGDST